jgi:hypothetical protein
MSQRNKDLPAMPVHPMQDKFGQVILMAGMSKQEIVAMEVLKSMMIQWHKTDDEIPELIKFSYSVADEFCSYLENESQKESSIII